MKCYFCGTELGKAEYCPECDADSYVWRIVCSISNRYYNDALEMARKRDLSGAMETLKKSLYFNKMNKNARNLLGLIYFEIGEPVSALSEWVISKSLNPEDNLASDYLDEIQNSGTKLENINQYTKKINQALLYCQQGSDDLAIIQLKKIVAMNRKSLKGFQLLALMYMKVDRYDLAMRTLKHAQKIDTYNTDTLHYMDACREHLQVNGKLKKEPSIDDDSVTYQNGNDIIIRPKKFRDNTAVLTVVNLLIGAAIGIAVAWFLILPESRQQMNTEANKQVVEANETISAKEQTITNLEDEIDTLNTQLDAANGVIDEDSQTLEAYKLLVNATAYYSKNKYETCGKTLQEIDRDLLDEQRQKVYDIMMADCQEAIMSAALSEAQVAYGQDDYDTCIPLYLQVVEIDEGYEDGKAAYYLAFSYMYSGQYADAAKWFEVTTKYASGSVLTNAQELQAEMERTAASHGQTLEGEDSTATTDADTTATDETTTATDETTTAESNENAAETAETEEE